MRFRWSRAGAKRAPATRACARRDFPWCRAGSADFAGRSRAGLVPLALSAARIASIGEFGPSSTTVICAIWAATSLMRSRSSAFSTRSEAQEASASRFIEAISLVRRARSDCARSSSFSSSVFSECRLRGRFLVALVSMSAIFPRRSDSDARAEFEFGAQAVAFAFALGEQAALLVQPRVHVLCALGERFRVRHLLVRAAARADRPACRDFRRGRARSTIPRWRRRRPRAGCRAGGGFLDFAFIVADAVAQGFDLRLERDQFDLLAVGGRGFVVELMRELGQFGDFVGQRSLGFAQRRGFDRIFLFGAAQLVLERFLARFEREDRRGLVAEFHLEAVDDVGFLSDFGELARRLRLHLLDAHFQAPGRHREFGAH